MKYYRFLSILIVKSRFRWFDIIKRNRLFDGGISQSDPLRRELFQNLTIGQCVKITNICDILSKITFFKVGICGKLMKAFL